MIFPFSSGSGLSAMNFLVHGFNTIMTMIDLFVSGRPCRLMHFYHPFVVWLAYIAFSSIYWAAGGVNEDGDSYIYPVLDWDNLSLTVPFVTVGLFVALPIVHTFLWALHLLRDYVFRKWIKRKSSHDIEDGSRFNSGFEL